MYVKKEIERAVVGSNPSTIYWMDILTIICCKICNDVCLKRRK